MIDRKTIEDAARFVHQTMGPTPQYAWPLLAQRCGAEVWVKHENHTSTGAFKVRGGLTYMRELLRAEPGIEGVIAATRGNHGQSVATAAAKAGLKAVIVVPHGNSVEKNAAMRAQGAELIEHGHDFQAAHDHARRLAAERGLHMWPSFHPWLIKGVATYGYELFTAVPDLAAVYVPIGLGSGICGTIAARDALGAKTEVIGVVATGAPAYALSFRAGKPIATNAVDTMADGVACRVPNDDAVAIINKGAARIVEVSDAEIIAAMRHYFTDTHNLAEGAGAAALAALLQERKKMAGRNVAVILTGGNVDMEVYARIIAPQRQVAAA